MWSNISVGRDLCDAAGEGEGIEDGRRAAREWRRRASASSDTRR